MSSPRQTAARPPAAEPELVNESDVWDEFLVQHMQERLALLRRLRDDAAPVTLTCQRGATITTSLWAVDTEKARLSFAADPMQADLQTMLESDEAGATAYLDNVKLQFDLHSFTLVRGRDACALQTAFPQRIHRFQRRDSFRVRPLERMVPQVRLRHPAIPDMQLALRVLDVSIGGCALWLPDDVPPLQPGTTWNDVEVSLDAATSFRAALVLQHASKLGNTSGAAQGGGARLGCEWRTQHRDDARALQLWLDRAQKRHRIVSLG